MQEVWKDIPGYNGRYQVSSLGRVRSIMRGIFQSRDGRMSTTTRSGKMLTPQKDRLGKPYVSLYDDRHRRHFHSVASLYQQAFTDSLF